MLKVARKASGNKSGDYPQPRRDRACTKGEIASQLSVSLRMVETHRARLMQKLGRRTRAELVDYAIEAGLVHLL